MADQNFEQLTAFGFSPEDANSILATQPALPDITTDNNAYKSQIASIAEGLGIGLPSPLLGFASSGGGSGSGSGTSGSEESTITSSESANNDLSDIDQMLQDLGLVLPDGAESDAFFDQAQAQLDQEHQDAIEEIRRISSERQRKQRQTNTEILGESKAALAELGILSTEPGVASATNAVQYIGDVKRENQREIDKIIAEEQAALKAARTAKSAGDLQLAKARLDDARALRDERNKLRLQAAAEIRAMREAERADDRLAIEKLIEERAARRFKREEAQGALDALVAANFEGFDMLSDQEVQSLERKLGFIQGTLDGWYKQSQKLTALEGWATSMQTNKNTGEVTAIYTRINPDTGQPEFMKQSLGRIGERFASSGNGSSNRFKLSANDRGKMLGAGISEADIDSLDARIRENGLVPEILEFLSDEQQRVVKEVYSGSGQEIVDVDTIVEKIKAGGFTKVITTSKEQDDGSFKDIKEEVLDTDAIPDAAFSEVMNKLREEGFFDTDDEETVDALNWWQRQWEDFKAGINPLD